MRVKELNSKKKRVHLSKPEMDLFYLSALVLKIVVGQGPILTVA